MNGFPEAGKGSCRGATEEISQTRQCLVPRQTSACVLKGRRISPDSSGRIHFYHQNFHRRSATAERSYGQETAQTQGAQIDQTREQRFLLPEILRPWEWEKNSPKHKFRALKP